MTITTRAVLVALHSFGSEELWMAGGADVRTHRKKTQGRHVATKRLLTRVGVKAVGSRKTVRLILEALKEAGTVEFSGRGRHAGWHLTVAGWVRAMAEADTPPGAVAVARR